MLTKQDVNKLLSTVYYNGEYAVKYHEQNDDGTFNLSNEYLGFTPYDDDGFLDIHISKDDIVVYEALTAFPPRDELISALQDAFPDKKIEARKDILNETTTIHYVIIHF